MAQQYSARPDMMSETLADSYLYSVSSILCSLAVLTSGCVVWSVLRISLVATPTALPPAPARPPRFVCAR